MPVYRVYFFDESGEKQQQDFKSLTSLLDVYEQVGVEQDSYTLRLHGEPILKGLIGPMSDGKTIVKYETPQVFVKETEEWSKMKRPRAE